MLVCKAMLSITPVMSAMRLLEVEMSAMRATAWSTIWPLSAATRRAAVASRCAWLADSWLSEAVAVFKV